MLARMRCFLAMPRFVDPEKERTAGFLYRANLLVAVCGPLLGLLGFLFARQKAWLLSGAALIALSVTVWSHWLLRRGYVQIASVLLCVVTLVLVTAGGLLGVGLRPAVAGGYVVVVFLAGLLIGWQGALVCGALSLVSSLALYLAPIVGGGRVSPNGISGWGNLALMGGVVASTTLLVIYLTRRFSFWEASAQRLESGSATGASDLGRLNASLTRRLDLLRGAMRLSSQIGPLLGRDEIARRAVALACELFPVEWVGLFLCEPPSLADGDGVSAGEPYLVLIASAGKSDASLGLPGERVALSASAALARCARSGESRVTEASGPGLGTPPEVLAPRVHSVLLLPLRAEGNVLGVLALSGGPPDASGIGYVDAAQAAADQVAVALHRAGTCADLRAAAALAERAVQRHVEESWNALVDAQPHLTGYRYTPGRSWADERAWLPPMAEAVREGVLVTAETSLGALLAVPLVQSGIVIGAIGLRRPANQPWSEEEQLLVQSVSEQVTQALENRRLFELARDRAQRERVLRQTTERIRSQADLDGALAAAADQIREIVGATHVAIRLAQPNRPDGTVQGNGRRTGNGG
ncbi:MAG TPA: GAF domain-containing protein [Anaerolineae bacterium]|nr:GAF domain-containing protein [Anaerolineae bacterium]